jgi:hypothetical protein
VWGLLIDRITLFWHGKERKTTSQPEPYLEIEKDAKSANKRGSRGVEKGWWSAFFLIGRQRASERASKEGGRRREGEK